jgi:hypothetical protein
LVLGSSPSRLNKKTYPIIITDTTIKSAIREAKTIGKVLKRCYERGMYLEVHPTGSALWLLPPAEFEHEYYASHESQAMAA